MRSDREGLPRWVKLGAIIVAVLVLLFVVMQLISGGDLGEHGPRRHSGDGEPAEHSELEAPGDHEPPVDHAPPQDHQPAGGGQ